MNVYARPVCIVAHLYKTVCAFSLYVPGSMCGPSFRRKMENMRGRYFILQSEKKDLQITNYFLILHGISKNTTSQDTPVNILFMTKASPDALWDECLSLIRGSVTEQQYKAWFEPIVFKSFNADTKTVLVQVDRIVYEVLEQNHVDLLTRVLT